MRGIGDLADGVARGVESLGAQVSEALFEPVIRLGVTGLSRAGKTVFITSLVANLLDRGRMPQLRAESSGAIRSVFLQPQPDVTVPRFDYESHLAAMTGPSPHWPESTRAISELRLSFKVQSGGMLGSLRGTRTVHLDIVDYPGEWLLDLGLMEVSYTDWAADVLGRIGARPEASAFLTLAGGVDPSGAMDESLAKGLAESFAGYLQAARKAGWSDCTPGRFLLPGEMAGSPALTFAPLMKPAGSPARGSLWREMERRFEAYKAKIVKPFFRDHFARIDRQVVLVDALGAIHAGPRAVEDLRRAMAEILAAFRPGAGSWLLSLLGARRVERILFAATKADHLHHSQHPQLTAIVAALMREARDRADFSGAKTAAMSLASLRATVEEELDHQGRVLPAVRGRLSSGKQAAFWPGELPSDPAQLLVPARPGELPSDPAQLLVPARQGAERWLDADYGAMAFLPSPVVLKPGEGPPHIRLDRAAEFLIGDRLS